MNEYLGSYNNAINPTDNLILNYNRIQIIIFEGTHIKF